MIPINNAVPQDKRITIYRWKDSTKVLICGPIEHQREVVAALDKAKNRVMDALTFEQIVRSKIETVRNHDSIMIVLEGINSPLADTALAWELGSALLLDKPMAVILSRQALFQKNIIRVADVVEYFNTVDDLPIACAKARARMNLLSKPESIS